MAQDWRRWNDLWATQTGVAHQLIATSQQHLTKAQEETDRIISLLELEKGSKAEREKALRNALNKWTKKTKNRDKKQRICKESSIQRYWVLMMNSRKIAANAFFPTFGNHDVQMGCQTIHRSACGSECRGFESHRAPKGKTLPIGNVFFYLTKCLTLCVV